MRRWLCGGGVAVFASTVAIPQEFYFVVTSVRDDKSWSTCVTTCSRSGFHGQEWTAYPLLDLQNCANLVIAATFIPAPAEGYLAVGNIRAMSVF
jgi:hypothetical protein